MRLHHAVRPAHPSAMTSQSPRALACVGSAHARAAHAGMAWHCSVIDRTGVRQHEWPKHGSCIANGLSSPADFFNMSLALRSLRLPPPAACCNRTATRCNIQPMPSSVSLPLRPLCHRCPSRLPYVHQLAPSERRNERPRVHAVRSQRASEPIRGRADDLGEHQRDGQRGRPSRRACLPTPHSRACRAGRTHARTPRRSRTNCTAARPRLMR